MTIQNEKNDQHEFSVKTRKEMSISGVTEVISFDEKDIHIITHCGEMYIEGRDMHIDVLDIDKEVVTLTGKIDAVFYSNDAEKEKNGFLGKLFK